MTDSCNRLKEERLRLKLSQAEFGEIGGVKKDAQLKYEAGTRYPDGRYYQAIAAAGADVQYILTGIPGHAIVSETSASYTHTRALTPEEEKHLDNLAHCTKEDQAAIKRMALLAAKAADKDETQPAIAAKK